MKVKTSNLTGAALDWAVATCEEAGYPAGFYTGMVARGNYNPSTDWAQGGPIIEREFITVVIDEWDVDAPPVVQQWGARSLQYEIHGASNEGWSRGPTPLIAAMRCLVTSQLGDEVEIPEEFL